jgi:diguanylate cyclase
MTFFVDLAFFLLAASCGVGVAWLVFARYRVAGSKPAEETQAHFARETLAKLQELASKVAADVDRHSSAVQEINAQLAESDDEASVLAAVARLIEANRKMQGRLDSAEQRLQLQARQMESHAVEARTDALTEVANRRALDDEIRRAIGDYSSRGVISTLMLIDVDHFKKFNDTHGHPAGDEVLRGVARVLVTNVGELGLVARYGGEEFAVIFAGLALPAVMEQAEKARLAIAGTSFRCSGRELFVTVSAGLTELQPGDQEQDLIRRADEALYASKKGGRNCGHYSDGQTHHRVKAEVPAAAPITSPSEQIGDEWMFEASQAAEMIFHEPLAHVSNRPTFFDDLIRRLSHWRRGGTPLALMLVQIDGLGRLAADHGTEAEETVLRVAAQLINAVMRDMDHVARLSDDTFALLMPGSQLSQGVAIGERLRSACERCRLPRRAENGHFTISVGVVEASEGDDLRLILERGRNALQAAIHQGRNRLCGQGALGCTVQDSVQEAEPEAAAL